MPLRKLVDEIFSIAKQIEERGGISSAASLRRGAKVFELKHDEVMLARCLETAKIRLAAIRETNEG
uniref:Uncharacterized protein n=1 Tax=viral metagenome TaxID=1070528 RepID=A0A6M3JKK3_9ZZZZ